ncbi:TonB-dependent receptor domain-containing protein [Kangiella aquimarina]|uniref:TonB-dependent receptor n=1 Tax=Kangiella aquimarina TaxID=261965 RepID=A0ABZ0X7B0_9GAMM|nr:TonB-dependent receptor [Kangiella aquimarina]WQG86483.1 TonB-dependent receptor [Kangiella aquimarina]
MNFFSFDSFRVSAVAFAVSSCFFSGVVLAEDEQIDVITISASRVSSDDLSVADADPVESDVAQWLKTVPGANVNKNGPVTGIAQYRGMFGDRVGVSLNGRTAIGAGPNAMDAPLTYAVPMTVEAMTVYRGIAPVTAGIDTMGGAVDVHLKRARTSEELSVEGSLSSWYSGINDGKTYAGDINVSANDFGLYAFISDQTANNAEDALGRDIITTAYDKQQSGLDMAYEFGNSRIGVRYGKTDTGFSGTPALPMDINYVDGEQWSLDGQHQFDGAMLEWQFGASDNTHGMDNFSQRENLDPAAQRYTYAAAKSSDYKLQLTVGDWVYGLQGYLSEHDVDISNPNNMMFSLINFNQVADDRHSAYVQWGQRSEAGSDTFGVRVKYNRADAGEVAHSMAMMSPAIAGLQNDFNQADRSVSDTTYDVTYHGKSVMSENFIWNYSAGIKQHAASYQQRYLWIPMQSTGGLADGKTYIGDINLDPETAYQLDAGFDYSQGGFKVSPRAFYSQVKDYIEGTPSSDPRAIMVAGMMGDPAPLQFTNIDSTLWGFDANWRYDMPSDFFMSGVVSYVLGERDDSDINLYRIAPLNTRFVWGYQGVQFSTQFAAQIYADQDRVSSINNETETAGYMVWDWMADYIFDNGLTVRAGIENLFDKQYVEHLGGVNRAAGSEIAVGERLPANARNVYVGFEVRF